MAECNCLVPYLEGAGNHALNCAVFADDRSHCCAAPIRAEIDYGDHTVINRCTSCRGQCQRVLPVAMTEEDSHGPQR